MPHSENPDDVLVEREENPIVPDPEPKRAGKLAGQFANVASSGLGEVENALEHAWRWDDRRVARRLGPRRATQCDRSALSAGVKVFSRQVEVGENRGH